MTIADALDRQARTRGEAAALIDLQGARERRITYRELEHAVAAAAGWLDAQGLRRGETVLVFVPISLELYLALLAFFRLGVVAMFVDPAAGREHLERCCARWAPQAFLGIRKAHALRLRSPALRRIPLHLSVGGWLPFARRWPAWRQLAAGGACAPEPAARPEDPALVTFTSGGTGVPKAAVRTHAFLLAQHRVLAPHLALSPGEVDFGTLPIFTLANLASGVTTVLPDLDLARPGSIDAGRVWRHLERLGVTRITASPVFFERLVEHGRRTGRTLPMLRKVFTGGAPVFPRLLAALQELAPEAELVAVYGSTEAEPIAHVSATAISADDLSLMYVGGGLLAGEPVPEIEVRVLHDRTGAPRGALSAAELARETVPIDRPGEIVVAGDHVLPGYLGGVGDEENKFTVDGRVWHRTGDAGRFDETGRLWLLGRCAARIEDADGRLYPLAVEAAVMSLPQIRRAALVAMDGERWLVVEADDRTPELAEHVRLLVAWARIRRVVVLPLLPVDARHNAKIDYAALGRLMRRRAKCG